MCTPRAEICFMTLRTSLESGMAFIRGRMSRTVGCRYRILVTFAALTRASICFTKPGSSSSSSRGWSNSSSSSLDESPTQPALVRSHIMRFSVMEETFIHSSPSCATMSTVAMSFRCRVPRVAPLKFISVVPLSSGCQKYLLPSAVTLLRVFAIDHTVSKNERFEDRSPCFVFASLGSEPASYIV